MTPNLEIQWLDAGREPQCPPDPAFPNGKDINADCPQPWCATLLPCPAKRIGAYLVRCRTCGTSIACTTAGRPDDPRSIKLPCRGRRNAD